MRYMHWSYADLLECPDDVIAAILRLAERDAHGNHNR